MATRVAIAASTLGNPYIDLWCACDHFDKSDNLRDRCIMLRVSCRAHPL